MSKSAKIILTIVIIAVVAVLVVLGVKFFGNSGGANISNITSSKDLGMIIDKVYSEVKFDAIPSLVTNEVNVEDADYVKMVTGLENGKDFEFLVASEPMMTGQAYSFVLAKVKPGINASQVAGAMCENVDMAKWICVQANKVYATSCGDIVCLIMSDVEVANSVYEGFKKVTGANEKVYEREAEEIELPPDMY